VNRRGGDTIENGAKIIGYAWESLQIVTGTKKRITINHCLTVIKKRKEGRSKRQRDDMERERGLPEREPKGNRDAIQPKRKT